jgi:hypothetical protein
MTIIDEADDDLVTHDVSIMLVISKSGAWSYQQKFSDLRNFQKNLENFKASVFVTEVRKIIKLMFWLCYLIRCLEMSFKTVLYELNQKYWFAILAKKNLTTIWRIF